MSPRDSCKPKPAKWASGLRKDTALPVMWALTATSRFFACARLPEAHGIRYMVPGAFRKPCKLAFSKTVPRHGGSQQEKVRELYDSMHKGKNSFAPTWCSRLASLTHALFSSGIPSNNIEIPFSAF